MLGVTDLWTFVLGTIAIVLLPGPNSMYVLAVAARRGVRQGYRGALGVFCGDGVLMLVSAAGMASLLRAVPALFMVVKYAGAAYLGYVGVRMVVSAVRGWRDLAAGRPDAAAAQPEPKAENAFRRAFTISLMNPKAILFFVSFFIQFVDPGYAYPAASFVLLAIIVQLCSALYLSLLIFSGNRLAATFRSRRRLAAAGTSAIGALFVGFGVKLATSSL
ncbi:leucine efflux protein LeuE [Catellatospora bangladeshensis]|uniref:Putative membrane protein n=1 Tax=Catellatospora bangladeshensis TaxID=310355 RepID=A0A8J3NIP5_9ACTN|nr:leucine efflux protein LeuE [Catellatospora bangladeshensis]GIF79565.1 putative membrane protein [Catellatospora bangladeshensis]